MLLVHDCLRIVKDKVRLPKSNLAPAFDSAQTIVAGDVDPWVNFCVWVFACCASYLCSLGSNYAALVCFSCAAAATKRYLLVAALKISELKDGALLNAKT